VGNAVARSSVDWLRAEVRQYRRDNALSRAEMARRLGLSLRTVVNIETGTVGLAPRTVRAWLALRSGPQGATAPPDINRTTTTTDPPVMNLERTHTK